VYSYEGTIIFKTFASYKKYREILEVLRRRKLSATLTRMDSVDVAFCSSTMPRAKISTNLNVGSPPDSKLFVKIADDYEGRVLYPKHSNCSQCLTNWRYERLSAAYRIKLVLTSTKERLRSHAKAFEGLLSLTPAKLYYGEDVSVSHLASLDPPSCLCYCHV
jgi:hypothetical protein